MALELGVVGLMNVQFAVKGGEVYVLEVNPVRREQCRTCPSVLVLPGPGGRPLYGRCQPQGTRVYRRVKPQHYFVKEAVFPFAKFPKVDPILGPEMKSTGEVMGVGQPSPKPLARPLWVRVRKCRKKALPLFQCVVDKPAAVDVARMLIERGFDLMATRGTAKVIADAGLAVKVNKVLEGRPHIVDMIKNDQIALIVNTTEGKQAIRDSFAIRRSALQHKVFYTTTITAAHAVCQALGISGEPTVRRLQDLHAEMQ